MPDLLISRVVDYYSAEPFRVTSVAPGEESVQRGNDTVTITYYLCRVPLDCIDDITRSGEYNPRRLKEEHRDYLMDQIGTYGLIQPLIGTVDSDTARGGPRRLYLIDGRHRYNGLLWLDPGLHSAVSNEAAKVIAKHETVSISDPRDWTDPGPRPRKIVLRYAPEREQLPGRKLGAHLIPVKIYVGQDEVQRIGMAVFLNRGQKKLAPGEEISKIAEAFEKALDEAVATATEESPASELRAVERVMQSNAKADASFVVISRHVAAVMNDEDSPWFYVVGRWQGESFRARGTQRWKPLTAGNFHAFVTGLVNDRPMEIYDEAQREREIWNLNRLGAVFRAEFDWPDDIPSEKTPYTATSVLARSFLIRALSQELESQFARDGRGLLSETDIDERRWETLQRSIRSLQGELADQAIKRRHFQKLKRDLERQGPEPSRERSQLLLDLDRARGLLWTLDTVIPALTSRIAPLLAAGKIRA